MDLNELVVFVRVVQAGSVRGAAERLGSPKSTVSRRLNALEERLQARLIQRTTRRLSLTDVGRLYFQHAERIVAEVESAELAVRSQQDAPRGLLRVTVPLNLALLGPIVADYLKRCPEVRLELSANARVVDLIEERFDLGIRIGRLEDSSLVARPVATVLSVLVATPAYLRRQGRPKTPADLAQHDVLLFGTGNTLALMHDGQVEVVTLTPRLLTSDMDVLEAGASSGLGIAALPVFRCEEALHAKRLVRALPDWRPPSTPMQVVYPSRRHLSPTARSFIDHLQQRMAPFLPSE